MRILLRILTLLLSVACASFFDKVEQTFATSQDECDRLYPPNIVFHHEFNQEACGCWIVYDLMAYCPICLDGKVLNPYSRPFNYLEGCLKPDDYQTIFDHNLGPDCIPNSGDEEVATSSTIIDIERAYSQDDCDEG